MIYVSTNESRLCPLCGDESLDMEHFEDSCNHLLGHGLKCLHVGQETTRDRDGNLWQVTVAVFGSGSTRLTGIDRLSIKCKPCGAEFVVSLNLLSDANVTDESSTNRQTPAIPP
jgi:hypothetical protein